MLINGEKSGQELRDELSCKHKSKKSLPAFYQLMDRMESAGLISGWYEQIEVKGHLVKERRYKINAKGERSFNESVMYYSDLAQIAS
jgi:DNA-binding PadR family transcriptional regulator